MARLDEIHAKLRPDVTRLPKFASILVVDDQRFDRMRMRRLIDELEFDTYVVEAASLEAMGYSLQGDKFDLILLDYNLPDGNGLQALEVIRHDPKHRQAAIIMVAGDGQNEIAIEAMKRGCSDYIAKDDLSGASLRRAAINALQKSQLSIGFETQDVKRKEIQGVLQRFSSECALEIKPVVSRMMRQLRDLRDTPPQNRAETDAKCARLEQSCMRLFEFLEDLERYQGSDLINSTYRGGDPSEPPAKPDTVIAPTKPRRVQATTNHRMRPT